MDLNEARKRLPELAGLSDESALNVIHQVYYPNMDRAALADRLGFKAAPPPVPERSMARAAGDLGLQFAGGAVSGVRMMSDLFGADNAVSGGLRGAEDALRELQSAAAKGDQQEISRILKEAEGKGVLDQVIAGAKAFGQAPGALIANALGTSVPTLATALIPGVGQGAMAARLAAGAGIGAAQGAGNTKSAIYEEVKNNPLPGETPEQTEFRAVRAQEYGGQNTGQIALGGVLGAAAGSTGMERALSGLRNGVTQAAPGMVARVGMGAAAEAVPEIAQGGQEKLAGNLALRNEGFDVDPMAGVVAGATMEGLAGGLTGGVTAIPRPAVIGEREPVPVPVPPVEPPGPMTKAVNALGPRLTTTPTTDLLGRNTDPLAGQMAADRLAAEDAAVTRQNFADRNGAMLAGGGLDGSRADPLANMLADARTSDANSFTNVQQAANRRPPMPASDAARILDEAKNRGMDLTAAPHPDGGFVVVPRQWVTPDVAAQAETEIADTLARMQQADAAPVERAERRRSEPVDLNLNTDPVAGYIEDLRNTNTPAARAYVGEFDAGRVTRADVEQRMQADRGKTADERLAEAAAEGLRMNPKGDPFKTLMAANLAAKTTPGTVIEVPGGYAIRPQESTVANTAAQEVPEADAAPVQADEPAAAASFADAADEAGAPAVSGVDEPGAVQALTNTGGFDSEAWDKARSEVIKKSREAGNTHLDKLPAYVETMRGKKVYYAHDPKVRGTIRTVDNNGNVYINWDDKYSAEKEMASPVVEGKKTFMRSSIGPRDLKDYVLAPGKTEAATTPTNTIAKRQSANVQDAPQSSGNPGQVAQSKAVEAPAPARGDGAAAAGVPGAGAGAGVRADGVNDDAPTAQQLRDMPIDTKEQAKVFADGYAKRLAAEAKYGQGRFIGANEKPWTVANVDLAEKNVKANEAAELNYWQKPYEEAIKEYRFQGLPRAKWEAERKKRGLPADLSKNPQELNTSAEPAQKTAESEQVEPKSAEGGKEELRRQLRDVENKIVGAAGLAPDFIEDAMKSRKVPAALKKQRKEIKEQLKATPPAESKPDQETAVASDVAAEQKPASLQATMEASGWDAEVAGEENSIWTKRVKGERYTALHQPASKSMEITVLVDGVDTQIASFKTDDAAKAAEKANKAIADDQAEQQKPAPPKQSEKPKANRSTMQEQVERPAKPDEVVATVGDQAAEGERKFYVTMVRGDRVARLAGPFDTKDEADAMVRRAKDAANTADPRSVFDAFGVSAVTSKDHKPGTLNGTLGIVSAGQEFTPADAQAAERQLAQMIGDRIDAMQAQAVQKIGAKFLPTMGIKAPIGKAKIKATVTDFTKVNPLAAASEFGVEMADSLRAPLLAQFEGRLVDATKPAAPAQQGAQQAADDKAATVNDSLTVEKPASDMTRAELVQKGRDDFAAGVERQAGVKAAGYRFEEWLQGWNEAKADAEAKADGKVVAPSDFPLQEVSGSYSGISHSGGGRARSDRDAFVDRVQALYDEAKELAKTEAQQTALDQAIQTYKDEYIAQTLSLARVRSGTYSAFVAGRAKINTRQADSRNSALDKAIDRFTAWDKEAAPKVKAAVLAARTADEVAAEQADKDAAQAAKQEKRQKSDIDLMRKILAAKGGDPLEIGGMVVTKVNNDKEGYPLTLTIRAKDGAALTNDKLNLATEVFGRRGVDGLRQGKEKIRALVDAIRAEGTTTAAEPKAEAAQPASKTPTVDRHEALMKSVREGKATAEQFKAAFESLVASKDAVLAELETKTKAELLKAGGYQYFHTRYANEKKADVARALYREMLDEYSLGDGYSYGMGKNAKEEAVRRIVEATDDAKLEQYAKDRQVAIAEAQAERAAKAAAMDNPQTLADFKAIIAKHIGEGKSAKEAFLSLTPEQRIQFDTLAAESTREAREARKRERKTEVRAAGQTTGGEIIATKHTRDGYDLFVVKLADRLSREDYTTVLASAKKLGGWYSAFRGNGAIPGFQFKDKANAEAFLKLAGGDTTEAQAQAEQRRDAFEDDRSETAVERLRTMADKLTEQAAEIENADRKTNTARRARFAASALNGAAEMKAKASTMRNIAQAIEAGGAKFLDAVRTKSQVDLLTGIVATAKNNELRAKYPSYADQEKRKGEPATAETADFAEFPAFTAYRSDLASLGRQLLEVDGTKKLGQRLMSVADDVSDAYLEFAKQPANLFKLSTFSVKRGDEVKAAIFPNREQAERAIARSGLTGKAIVLAEKRGVNRIIMSPSEAINAGIWTGDGDKRITLSTEFGNELVETIGRRGNKSNKLTVPWQFQNAYDRRKALSRLGIETPSEYRSALREFIGLQERAIANKVKEMELAMVGRKADGLDFFPTPAEIADQMIEAAEITPEMAVLEPSAGMGHIADRIREAGAEPDVIEISPERRELLLEKGYHLAETDDFMAMQPRKFFTYGDVFRAPDGTEGVMQGSGGMGSRRVVLKPLIDGVEVDYRRGQWYDRDELTGIGHRGSWSGYDRIIMNPPFSNRRDAEHVMHAYTLLKPGGRIVAIMGEGVFFGQDKKAQEFREWLESVNGTSEKLPAGSFMDPSLPVNTGVSARMVVIDKPAGDVKFSIDDSTGPADTADYGPATQAHRDAAARLAESFADRIENGGSHTDLLDAVAPGDGKHGQAAAAVASIARRLFRRQVVFVKFKGTPLFNGVVSKSVPGVVFLNIDSQKPLLSVLGHELLHEMAKSHPTMYANLSRRLDDLIKNETEYAVRTYNAYKKAGISTKGLDTREELEADIVGDNFMDAGFWQAMGENQPGLFKRIVNFVTKWLDNLAEKIADYRPFGTDEFLTDIAAARDAVAGAMREFSGAEAGAVADPVDGDVKLSAAGMTEQQAIAAGFTMKAYRGVSKSKPFNDTGGTWLTTSREVAEAYAEEVMGYDDPAVITVMVNPDGLKRHDASRLTDEQRAELGADDFGNPQAVGIYDRSDDHPLGGSRRNVTVIHAPREAVAVIDQGGAKLSAAENQDQTQTAAFKRWFAGSKVVDSKGSPMVVYHGSPSPDAIGEFQPKNGGIYFSNDRKTAEEYTAQRGIWRGRKTGAVTEAFVALKTPLVIDAAGKRNDNIPVPWQQWKPKAFGNLPAGALSVQAVAEYAEANGYDGLIVRNVIDTADIKDTRKSDVFVAFNSSQVKSATGNRGTFDPDNADIRFSVADDIKKALPAFDVKTAPKNSWAHYRGMAMQALGRRQIVDLYAEELPQLAQYDYLVQKMDAEKNDSGAEADKLAQDWGKLRDEKQLAELMHDATLAQIDPAKPMETGVLQAQYRELKARFDALTPEAQSLYRQARDMYDGHYRKVQKAIKERIERSEMSAGQKRQIMAKMDEELFKKLKGVYFPLARFGQYVIVVKDANGEVKNVTRAETVGEAEEARKELHKAFPKHMGYTVGKVLKQAEFNAGRDAVGKGFMADLMDALDAKGIDDELRDTVAQLYLSSLPDLSWAKHGIHRKGTPGFSQDARRAFAQNMFHGARYLAKLRYADQLQDELIAMQDHVKAYEGVDEYDSIQAQQVVDEMVKRHEIMMNPKSSPVSTALTSLGFVFHLGLSPASAMVNLSQTALVAYPMMGAKWGWGKASAALLAASQDVVKAKNDLGTILKGAELDAYERAVKDGTIDVTMAHDLAGISQGEDQKVFWKIRPVMRAASFMFHHAERFNRQATFIAAWRMAKEAGPDKTADQLYEEAKKLTYDSHFDYSAGNRPRMMQGNWQRVIFLFRQYSQAMVYTLSRNAYLSMKGLTPADRALARKNLGGILATHAAAAGVLGLPLVGPLLTAASFIGSDDDEPWDAEVAMQNVMADMVGPKAAEVMARGFSRLTPFDLSGRVALNKLILPDVQEGLEGKQWAESAMAAALGPVAGIGVNMARGFQKITEGHYMTGLEDMMPTALRAPLRAMRYASEGAVDKTGVVIADEVGPGSIAGQALGFSPSEVRRATERKAAIMDYDRSLADRRSSLVRQWAEAQMAGDTDGVKDVMAEIQGFNQKNPNRKITMPHLIQSVRARRRRIEQAEDGVYLPKNRDSAREAVRF